MLLVLLFFCVQGMVSSATRNERPVVVADTECPDHSCDPEDFPLIKSVCCDRNGGTSVTDLRGGEGKRV